MGKNGGGTRKPGEHRATTLNTATWKKLERAADARLQRMTLDEKIGQLLCWDVLTPALRNDPSRIVETVERFHLGSLFVYDWPSAQISALTAELDVLKQELGFRGCLVSDAIPMIGIGSHVKADELAVRNVAAGSDVVLFCEPERDFPALRRAVEQGVITGERLHDAVRRVLTMKARLGSLETRRPVPAVTAEELAGYQAASRAIADQAATLSRNMAGLVPLRLQPGAKVLTITLKYDSGAGLGQDQGERYRDLTVVDEELRRRGLVVDHACNDMSRVRQGDYEAVFVNVKIVPHCLAGTVRMVGHLAFQFWNSVLPGVRNLVITAFGNPYLADEIPSARTMLLMYDGGPDAQRAAVATWLGEQESCGRSPVALDRTGK